ncbi:SURF1 family protein [Nocardioides sp. TRM66260-LWL]|uniref:SURF1 family cytochrome oxidase biogenesis protein n=1 Tax=Nocardioides sp. TRM66260-LWL TaxID=2874478 RepID=UPI001CC4B0BC|nr:SURF1 family protein [Nocardioides sp. TRM66260-LWL]MBZ5733919.1 SURF1 family protein [Nocardioides sp. TRM66260-LWL]
MGSLRFLISRRWALFAVAVVLIAYATWWLGEWQFGRLADRKENNAIVRTNEALAPTPVQDVLAPGRPVAKADEWRVVSARGTYDAARTIVVRYRTRDGASGVDLLVPLVTADGTTLLVDRGWLPTDNAGGPLPPNAPQPPTGEVEVQGYVRADGSGDSTTVDANSVRAVSSTAIAAAQQRTVYGGWVELRSEDGRPAEGLRSVELPELDNGPHFFYGLQWWFFGVLAVFGFFYLLYDEWRRGPRGTRSRAGGADGADVAGQDAVAATGDPLAQRLAGPFGGRPPKAKKPRQTNHPYARMRAEAEARAAAEEAARREAERQAADRSG